MMDREVRRRLHSDRLGLRMARGRAALLDRHQSPVLQLPRNGRVALEERSVRLLDPTFRK